LGSWLTKEGIQTSAAGTLITNLGGLNEQVPHFPPKSEPSVKPPLPMPKPDLTSAFSFQEGSPALTIISTGKDNIGGAFSAQDIHEYAFTADSLHRARRNCGYCD
jgi:hypothetical protein